MKTTTLLIVLLLFSSVFTTAQVTLFSGLMKSEIKPRTAPPPPLPPPPPSDSNLMNVNIWPSPAPGDFNLLIRTPVNEKIEVQVFDLSGRAVLRFEPQNEQTLPFGSTLSPGLYIVYIRQAQFFEEPFKVMKQ